MIFYDFKVGDVIQHKLTKSSKLIVTCRYADGSVTAMGDKGHPIRLDQEQLRFYDKIGDQREELCNIFYKLKMED